MYYSLKKYKLYIFTLTLIVNFNFIIAQEPMIYIESGHKDPIKSIALSPDGKIIASSSYDKTFKLWDVNSGREIITLQEDSEHNKSIVFSSDGKTIALISDDNTTIKLLDVNSGKLFKTLKEYKFIHNTVALSPDGKIIAFGSLDKTIKLWDVNSNSIINTLQGHIYNITSLAFSPDGKTIASSSEDRTIKLWDVNSGLLLKTLKGHEHSINFIVFSPDGKIIASVSADSIIKLWDVKSGLMLKTFIGHKSSYQVLYLAFSPDSNTIASSSFDELSFDGTILIWDMKSGNILKILKFKRDYASKIVFSLDGSTILTTHYNYVKIWNVKSGKIIGQIPLITTEETITLALFPYMNTIATVNKKNQELIIHHWDIINGRKTNTIKKPVYNTSIIASSYDGNKFVTNEESFYVKFWNVRTGNILLEFQVISEYFNSGSFSLDGSTFAAKSTEDFIKVWNARTGKLINELKKRDSFALSPDGKWIVLSNSNNTLELMDIKSNSIIKTFQGHDAVINFIVFSPKGNMIASSSDNSIKLWDVNSGNEIRTIQETEITVKSLAFSPNGRHLASVNSDNTIKLWDVNSGQLIHTLQGHNHEIESIMFFPNRNRMISCDKTSTRLWDLKTGKEIIKFVSFMDDNWIIITPEGYFNASPGSKRYLNVKVGDTIYPIDNYYKQFYKPQYIQSVLQEK